MRYLLIALLLFSFSSAQAQTKYFPYKVTDEGEVIAPFGDPDAAQKPAGELGNLFDPLGGSLENSSNIDTPHRSESQLARWSGDIIVRATSLSNSTVESNLQELKQYFTQAGWDAYRQFLAKEKIAAGLKQPGYKIASYNLQEPELMGKGAAGGAFKWVYDVPLFLEKQGASEKINIVVQLTRVPSAKDEHDVKIESWKVERLSKLP